MLHSLRELLNFMKMRTFYKKNKKTSVFIKTQVLERIETPASSSPSPTRPTWSWPRSCLTASEGFYLMFWWGGHLISFLEESLQIDFSLHHHYQNYHNRCCHHWSSVWAQYECLVAGEILPWYISPTPIAAGRLPQVDRSQLEVHGGTWRYMEVDRS